jgi:RHS repeat-associated protein
MVNVSSQRYKRIDYDFDLISGKVNKVIYQPDAPDMFIHRYNYDADNRITRVETSTDDIVYKTDAKYFYYAHGPLARVEYGENQVQGLDYAYTLQGWIKGVNSNTLSSSRDMGQDGLNDSTNANAYFAEDAFGYTLGYYEGDYKAISGVKWNTVSNRFEAQTAGAQFEAQRHNLYNGNISHMVSTIVETDTTVTGLAEVQTPKPLASAYKYDQLNRLKKSVSFNNISIPSNLWQASGQTVSNMYANTFSYDANGNILTQDRYDDAGVKFENMDYRYKKDANGDFMHNRLYHVNDSASSGLQSDDIDDQGAFNSNIASMNSVNNYRYDEIGNLIADSTEQIDTIKWTVYGKIKEIKRTSGSTKKNLKFDYDPSGNRVAKHVLSSSGNWEKSTYYVRDAQGHIMSTYDEGVVDSSFSFKLKEQHLYGSSRIGMNLPEKEMIGADTTQELVCDTLGKKIFELGNHLSNILSTVYDRKIAVDTNSDGVIDKRFADIASASDYAAFGVKLINRGFENSKYSMSFNGKMDDEETGTQDYGMRIYNPSLGRFLSVDPLTKTYPELTPYQFASNKPINSIDLDGLESADCYHYLDVEGKYTGHTEIKIREKNGVLGDGILNHQLVMTSDNPGGMQQSFKFVENFGKATYSPSAEASANSVKTEKMHEAQLEAVFPALKVGKEVKTWAKEADRALEGQRGFDNYVGAIENTGEFLENVSPLGKKTPIIGQVGTALTLASDFMKTMADVDQKGLQKGVENGLTRTAAFIAGEGLKKLGGTGFTEAEDATKLLLNKAVGEAKNGATEANNKEQ